MALVVLGAILVAPGTASAATISISPLCGGNDVALDITADGLPPGQDLYLQSRRPNGDIDTMGSYADPRGHLEDVFDIYLGNSPGAWISVHSYGTNTQHIVTWYEVGCATFSASPNVLVETPGAQPFTVTLKGFQPGRPVEISTPGLPPVTVRPAKGDFTGTVTFPRQPACGRSVLTARQRTDDPDPPKPPDGPDITVYAAAAAAPGPDRMRTVPVVVLCPKLSITPTTVTDSALPGPATVTGTDWVPSRPLQLTIGGAALATVTPARDGSFTSAVRLPRLACGPQTLVAQQVIPKPPLTLRRTATVTVRCTPAFLAVNPAVTPDGSVTTASGAGFTPGRTVRLEWIDLDNRPLGDAGTVLVGAGGTFLHPCLVLPNSLLGTRRLRAIEVPAPGDPVAGKTGTADLLVVPSTMQRGRDQLLERG